MLYTLLAYEEDEFPAGFGWHHKIKQGFHLASLWSLAEHLGVSATDIATLVGVPVEAVTDENRADLMSAAQSDRAFRLAVAYHRLFVAFKDLELVAAWLRNPRKEIAGAIPVMLLMSTAGAEPVYAAIEKIKPIKRVAMNEAEAVQEDEEPAVGDSAPEVEPEPSDY